MATYGRIKNGQLIVAPVLFVRSGELCIDDTEYERLGYKRVLYRTIPEIKEGYVPVCKWKENEGSIEQIWDFQELESDFSGELLVSVRNYVSGSEYVINSVIQSFKQNSVVEDRILKDNPLIAILIQKSQKAPKELLKILHEKKLNLSDFFTEIGLFQTWTEKGFCITENSVCFEGQECYFTYFKSVLNELYELGSCSTFENILDYDKAYIFLFTMFDEILLKMITIICKHESGWIKTNEAVQVEKVLECSDVEEIRKVLVEEKRNKLSWESVKEKMGFLKNHGICLDNQDMESRIIYIAEKRNIIVHNSGVWNSETLSKLEKTEQFLLPNDGEVVERTIESLISECKEGLVNSVLDLNSKVCEKFKFINRY